MQGELKVGEVVVGVGFVIDPEYNCMEGIVVVPEEQGLGLYSNGTSEQGKFYEVEWENGETNFVKRNNLKRKKPPTSYKGETTIMEMFLPKNIENNKALLENDIEEKTLETV